MTATERALLQLQKARERLTPPSAWIKGEFARDSQRRPVHSASAEATCWCSVGALNAALGEVSGGNPNRELSGDVVARHLLRSVTRRPIAQFNDSPYTTHEDVLAAFDEAIAMAKGTV
jgi:hypothetical protein